MVLAPLFEQSVYNKERQLRKKGYAPEMDAVFSICEGNVIHNPKFETAKLVPQLHEDNHNHQYIFLPLHEDYGNMGYIVFCDDFGKIKKDTFLRKYVERINLILGKYLRDLRVAVLHARLVELTETDALTRVKNRTAYKSREENLDNKISSNIALQFAIAVFDVNNLKKIIDQLGHEAGDDYIINSCRLICRIFKKSAVYRIGGDEFAVVLEDEDYEHREELMAELVNTMENLQKIESISYKQVSVAGGMAVYDRETDREFADVFKRADAAMYMKKAHMKQQMQ